MASTKAHDGEEVYSEVELKVQVRILGTAVTRSRMTVNMYPDPSLARRARHSLKPDQCGHNDAGQFVVNLGPSWNGWLDLNHDYPRFDPARHARPYADDVEAMNELLRTSVEWMIKLHERSTGPKRRSARPSRP